MQKNCKSELDDVTRDQEDCITELELLRGNLRKLGVIIDDVEIMTHILSILPEEYENIVENFEEKLDDRICSLTIDRIWGKLSAKYSGIIARSNKK